MAQCLINYISYSSFSISYFCSCPTLPFFSTSSLSLFLLPVLFIFTYSSFPSLFPSHFPIPSPLPPFPTSPLPIAPFLILFFSYSSSYSPPVPSPLNPPCPSFSLPLLVLLFFLPVSSHYYCILFLFSLLVSFSTCSAFRQAAVRSESERIKQTPLSLYSPSRLPFLLWRQQMCSMSLGLNARIHLSPRAAHNFKRKFATTASKCNKMAKVHASVKPPFK